MIAAGSVYVAYPSRTDVLRLWSLGDLHHDERACARKLLCDTVAEIAADPYSFWIGMGDYNSYLLPSDKRFDPQTVDMEMRVWELGQLGRAVAQKVVDIFEPIKSKCIGLLNGNHEATFMRGASQEDLHTWMCLELGVPNLEYCCLYDLKFVRRPGIKRPVRMFLDKGQKRGSDCWAVRIYAHHGAGAATTKGGKVGRLEKFIHDNPYADLYLMAHVHDENVVKVSLLGGNEDCTDIVQREKIGAITGGFLRTYAPGPAGYGERAGMSPTTLGATVIDFAPNRREMWGTTKVRMAKEAA